MYHKDDHAVSSQDDDVSQQQDDKKDHLPVVEAGQTLDDEERDFLGLLGAINETQPEIQHVGPFLIWGGKSKRDFRVLCK